MNKLAIINQDYLFNYTLIGDRHKPVILILHGFMGNGSDFPLVVSQLKDYCCLMVDLPGHGKTKVKQDTNYQMSNLALALIKLLEELGIKQCGLWGYSMGGRIALYLAIYFPQYFQGVILESASPGLETQAERNRRIAQDFKLAQKLESTDLSQFIQQWYSNPLFDSLVQYPHYQQLVARRLNNDPEKLAKSLRLIGLGMQPTLWNYLSQIEISLLLVVGELDSKFIAINHKILDLCPQAKLNVVKDSGHNVHFEQPSVMSELIRQFFTLL